jgi:hypothetical protein
MITVRFFCRQLLAVSALCSLPASSATASTSLERGCEPIAKDIIRFLDETNGKISLGNFQATSIKGADAPALGNAINAEFTRQLNDKIALGQTLQLGGKIYLQENGVVSVKPEIINVKTRTLVKTFSVREWAIPPQELPPLVPELPAGSVGTLAPPAANSNSPSNVLTPRPSTHVVEQDGWVRPSAKSAHKIRVLAGSSAADMKPRQAKDIGNKPTITLSPDEIYFVEVSKDGDDRNLESVFRMTVDGISQFAFTEMSKDKPDYCMVGGKVGDFMIKGWLIDLDKVSAFSVKPISQAANAGEKFQKVMPNIDKADIGTITVNFHPVIAREDSLDGMMTAKAKSIRTTPGEMIEQKTEVVQRNVDLSRLEYIKIFYAKPD